MIFDASSIYTAIRDLKVEILKGNATCELARYEMGNALLKEVIIHRSIGIDEAQKLMQAISRTIRLMDIRSPEWKETLKTASELEISFYDASYVQLALDREDILITEDRKLKDRVEKVVEAKSFSDIC